jgi:hypothetical protein
MGAIFGEGELNNMDTNLSALEIINKIKHTFSHESYIYTYLDSVQCHFEYPFLPKLYTRFATSFSDLLNSEADPIFVLYYHEKSEEIE